MKFLPCDIMLTTSNDPISWGIRLATRGPWSHSQLVVGWPWVISADAFKVNVRKVHKSELEKYAIRRYPLFMHTDQLEQILNYAKTLDGKPFDFLGMLLFGTGIASGNAYWCSELVYACFLAGGIALLDNVEPELVEPNHFWVTPSLKNVFVKG